MNDYTESTPAEPPGAAADPELFCDSGPGYAAGQIVFEQHEGFSAVHDLLPPVTEVKITKAEVQDQTSGMDPPVRNLRWPFCAISLWR